MAARTADLHDIADLGLPPTGPQPRQPLSTGAVSALLRHDRLQVVAAGVESDGGLGSGTGSVAVRDAKAEGCVVVPALDVAVGEAVAVGLGLTVLVAAFRPEGDERVDVVVEARLGSVPAVVACGGCTRT